MQTILTHARLVLENEVVNGTVVMHGGEIVDVDEGRSHLAQAIDLEGDLLAPGLVECHTDNLEKHFMPRPKVMWPNPVAAALAHDAQMAAAGVTTVYDALCAGGYDESKDYRRVIFHQMVEAIEAGVAQGLFRIEHRIHLRCELSDTNLTGYVAPHAEKPLVCLASLMDHTPGQRQWRDIETLRTFVAGEGLTDAEVEQVIAARIDNGSAAVSRNWAAMVELFGAKGIPIASHDDTTLDHVEAAAASGCTISEFPTTREAAAAAKAAGLATVAGAPNVVRGGSHSGGVAVRELAEAGILDALSSDYVPSSLLQAVLRLNRESDIALHEAFGLVTWKAADMLGLADRGRLAKGQRADLVQVKPVGETPVVRGVWVAGRQVF